MFGITNLSANIDKYLSFLLNKNCSISTFSDLYSECYTII